MAEMKDMNGMGGADFDPKVFRAQLAAVIEHHGLDESLMTTSAVIADYLDHCLQSLARAVQDWQLVAAQPTPEQQNDELKWVNNLLNSRKA